MLGLPGDFTPPSRFVRAVAFSKTALPVDKAKDGVLQAFHILNQFDIPKGAAQGIEHGNEVYDYTLWTSAADLKISVTIHKRLSSVIQFASTSNKWRISSSTSCGVATVCAISSRSKER